MTRRQVGITFAIVVCSAVLVAVPVMGLGGGVPAQVDNTTNETNGTFGQQVSSFMQASAADVNSSVESGMWQASVNQTLDDSGDATPKIAGRTARLERKLQNLQNRSDELAAQRDELPAVAYTARASALREQIANLKADINNTAQTATRVGVNASRLDRLRTAARNATGPEIAASARNITDAPRGPPADVPGNGPPGDAGPGNAGQPANRTQSDTGAANNSVDDASGNGTPPATGRNQTNVGDRAPTNQTNDTAVDGPHTNQTNGSIAGGPHANQTNGSAGNAPDNTGRQGEGGGSPADGDAPNAPETAAAPE